MSDNDYVRMCRNRRCNLVCRPDVRIHPKGDTECPKCGTPYMITEEQKLRDGEGVQDGHKDSR
jgi:hypothetical protein